MFSSNVKIWLVLKRSCVALTLALVALVLLGGAAGAISWTPHPLSANFNDVIFDGTQFWAVGDNGLVQTSPDGATWTSVAPGPSYNFYGIAHGGGGQYVVVGAGSGSTNVNISVYVTNNGGLTWSQGTVLVSWYTPALFGVAHGATAGEYVAVGGASHIHRSTDGGATWSPSPHYWYYYGLSKVIHAPIGTGLYVAVGNDGSILTSNDGGITWTAQYAPGTVILAIGNSMNLYDVAYANGLLVAVGWDTYTSNGVILTSPDGVNWTQVTPNPTAEPLYGVTHGPCGWVAVGAQGTVLSSPNGTSWTAETSNTTAALRRVAYGNNRYVAVGEGMTVVGQCSQPADMPDLSISKAAEGPLVSGQLGSYQITVSNVGTASMPGPITVTDTLPADLSFVSATGTGWSCSASGQTVTCTHPGPVPAGGSLPPITLTVQVAADAQKVENCATVKMVEQPPTPEVPHWVYIPDANPANDRACDVSPVGPGEGKPAKICGVKFLDHDGDGVRDANEPGLPGWTIQIKDAGGNVVGTAVTGKKGRFCIEVKAGTYTVSEVAQPGWVQTAPPPVPPGTATVTVASGQTAMVQFGNRPEKQPCCLTFTLQGGKADQFSTADGAAAEPATPPPGQPQTYFDETAGSKVFRHRFTLPAGNCIREAKLEVFIKPLNNTAYDNKIALVSGSQVWLRYLGNGVSYGYQGMLPNAWLPANYSGGYLLTLDLAALPLPAGGTMSLLGALDANRVLDLQVWDETSVDYARLTVRFCECAQGEAEGLAAAAREGASEVRLFVGKPQLVADGMEREIDVPPVVRGGRTFLPVRALAEALGLDVAWDPAEQRVTLSGDEQVIELWVGKPEAAISAVSSGAKLTKADAARQTLPPRDKDKPFRGESSLVPIDPQNPAVAPFIENGRVMLPVRFIAESLGLEVRFEPARQEIKLWRSNAPPDVVVGLPSLQGLWIRKTCLRTTSDGRYCELWEVCRLLEGGTPDCVYYERQGSQYVMVNM